MEDPSFVVGSFSVFCWVFRVQGFHNNCCEWTDALVVNLASEFVMLSWHWVLARQIPWNYVYSTDLLSFELLVEPTPWISTCFLFFFSTLDGFVSWNLPDSALNARSPLVFAEIIWGCPVEVWLICGSSLFCIIFSLCTWTRPDCVVRLFLLMQLHKNGEHLKAQDGGALVTGYLGMTVSYWFDLGLSNGSPV